MYAVIQTGGKQYRVQEGDVLRVAKLAEEAGKKVSFDDVLMLGEGDAINFSGDAAKTSVAAEVIEHGRDKKVEIFKKRRRKHSQKTQGHRQDYTAVRITKIGAAKAVAAKKAVAKKDAAEKPVAKTAAVKKEAVAEVTAKPAAKKISSQENQRQER